MPELILGAGGETEAGDGPAEEEQAALSDSQQNIQFPHQRHQQLQLAEASALSLSNFFSEEGSIGIQAAPLKAAAHSASQRLEA